MNKNVLFLVFKKYDHKSLKSCEQNYAVRKVLVYVLVYLYIGRKAVEYFWIKAEKVSEQNYTIRKLSCEQNYAVRTVDDILLVYL